MNAFLVKSTETIDPRGMAKFDPMGMIGTIYNWDYQKLLNTKYKSSGPAGFREEVFFSFSYCKSFDPTGHDWHNLCRGKLAIAPYQISRLWALWFQKRRFLYIFFLFLFIHFLIKTYMLPWQPEFQSNLPKNNIKPFLLMLCV